MFQVQGGMWICECDEWDFVSYHPQFPEGMQLYIETIKRDDAFIEAMAVDVLSAVREINSKVNTLLSRYGSDPYNRPVDPVAAKPAAPSWRDKFLNQQSSEK
jgi:hypothetical protein